MRTMKSAERVAFEERTFPHLEALYRTALWLTMRKSDADDLVVKAMAQAYLQWRTSTQTVDIKARLFRVLVRESSATTATRRRPDRLVRPRRTIPALAYCGERRYPEASIEEWELTKLAAVSDVAVKGTIAHLGARSRLIMILLLQERFTYAEIAYVTDLREQSVRMILGWIRRLISRQLAFSSSNPTVAAERHTPLSTAWTSVADSPQQE